MVVAYAGEQSQNPNQRPKDTAAQLEQRQPAGGQLEDGSLGRLGPQSQQAPPPPPPPQARPSGPLQTIEGDFNVVRGDVTRAGGFVAGEVEAGVVGYEHLTQPIRNVTQGPQMGTPAGTKFSGQTITRQQQTEFGTVEKTTPLVEGTAAQGPTKQQQMREGAFLAAGIVPGGDLFETGAGAIRAGLATDIASRLGLGAIYGGSTSALKGGTPEQIGESAALGGAFFAGGALAGRAAGAIGPKLAGIGDTFRAPSTVESETGLYSGTVGGRPGLASKFGDIFQKPQATPGQQLTDIPGGEAPIATRQFGEVFAQKKFGIEPTPGVSYEYEYGGAGKPFQYSAIEARQEAFGRSGGPAGPGYGGGGGRGPQTAFEEQSLRTPPGSPFSETQYFRTTFQEPSADIGPSFRTSFAVPGFASGSASSSALKTILPPLSSYKTVSGQSPSQGAKQTQQQQGSGIQTPQGSGSLQTYVQTTQQQTQQQQQPTPDVTIFRASPSPQSVSAFPASEGRPFSAGFAQPPSLGVEKRRRKALFGSREIHYPIGSLFDFSAIRGEKKRGKRK